MGVRDVPGVRGAVLSLGVVVALAFPAAASAAQSISVSSPTGFPAGGDPTFTTATTLDTSAGSPSLFTVRLAPGVLSSLGANPSCLTGAPQYTSACQIGQGSAQITPGALPFNVYLVPPSRSADIAGIDLVSGPPQAVAHAAIQLGQTPSGNVQTVLQVDLSQLGDEAPLLSGITLTLNGALDGRPFNRMPTNCTPGSTTLTVVYANGTETSTASPDVAPTGCSSLRYAPRLSGTATKDTRDNGVAVSTVLTQAPGEAASSAATLALPWPALSANSASSSLLGTSTPVGAATMITPLLASPLSGTAYVTGSPFSPTLTVRFPAPTAMTLTGNLDSGTHTLSFPSLPDLPLTSLTVTLYGGPKALLSSACAHPTGTLGGTFTAQTGARVHATRTLTVAGCPAISSASLSGLGAGKPKLRLKLTAGSLRAFSLWLPSGVSFNGRGLARGVSVRGPHALKLIGSRLRVTLRRPRSVVSVTIAPAALRESSRLRHHPPHLKFRLALTDASGATSTRTVVL